MNKKGISSRMKQTTFLKYLSLVIRTEYHRGNIRIPSPFLINSIWLSTGASKANMQAVKEVAFLLIDFMQHILNVVKTSSSYSLRTAWLRTAPSHVSSPSHIDYLSHIDFYLIS